MNIDEEMAALDVANENGAYLCDVMPRIEAIVDQLVRSLSGRPPGNGMRLRPGPRRPPIRKTWPTTPWSTSNGCSAAQRP